MDGRGTGCHVWRHRRASSRERRGESQVPVASLRRVDLLLREVPGIGIPRHAITECFRAHLKRLLTIHSAAEDDQVNVTFARRGEDRGIEVGIFPADQGYPILSHFLTSVGIDDNAPNRAFLWFGWC